jgi:VIT1/CCC1 family predicted Fe2+/Mn2+ transporter
VSKRYNSVMAQTELPRDELSAAIEARRELGQELEPQVVDSFLARIEKHIDERIDERTKNRLPVKQARKHELALAIVSIVAAIPLLAIAGGTAGLPGVVAVAVALVLLNVVFKR